MESKYMDIEIKRARSEMPRGFKHYSTETVIESNLLDVHYCIYKMKSIFIGDRYEQGNERKILHRISERLFHPDRNPTSYERPDGECGATDIEEAGEGHKEGTEDGTQEIQEEVQEEREEAGR